MIGMTFAGIDLQDGEYTTTETDGFGSPQKEAKILQLARQNGSIQVFERILSRSITAGGYIKAENGLALKQAMDVLKSQLLSGEQLLRITEDGEYREWTARMRNINIARDRNQVTYATWSAEFFSEKPFSVDGITDTIVDETITADSDNFYFNNVGSYYGQPEITIILTDIEPNSTPITISIGNPSTSQFLDFTDTFQDGDTITINTLTRRCFKGTQPISPEGEFPAWLPGPGTFAYSDTGTSRSVDITATLLRRYL